MDGQENLPSKRAAPDPGGESQPTQLDVLDELDEAPEPVEVVDEGVLGEAGRNWCRPPAPVLNPNADKLGARCMGGRRAGGGRPSHQERGVDPSRLWHRGNTPARHLNAVGRDHVNFMTRPNLPPPSSPCFRSPHAVFQQLEIDYTSAPSHRRFYGEQLKEAPILRMFGVTEHGNARCLACYL